jgi:hypothetical protein
MASLQQNDGKRITFTILAIPAIFWRKDVHHQSLKKTVIIKV